MNVLKKFYLLGIILLISHETFAASAPVFSEIPEKISTPGKLLTFSVSATNPNNRTLSYSAENLPLGAVFTSATKTFSWTPALTQLGFSRDIIFTVSDGLFTTSKIISIMIGKTPDQFLKEATPPHFRTGHTLLPLTRWSFPINYDMNLEMADRWGYALEIILNDIENTYGDSYKLINLARNNPGKYRISTRLLRPLLDSAFLPTLPPETWTYDENGVRFVDPGKNWVFSPTMPDLSYKMAGAKDAVLVSNLRAKIPIDLIQNDAEYGLSVEGFGSKYWTHDAVVMADKGSQDWFSYISKKKAHLDQIITDQILAASGADTAYIYYVNVSGYRNMSPENLRWGYDFKDMKSLSSVPSGQAYFGGEVKNDGPWVFNRGLPGGQDVLTKVLGEKTYPLTFGSQYSLAYEWFCGGWPAPGEENLDSILFFIDDRKYADDPMGGWLLYKDLLVAANALPKSGDTLTLLNQGYVSGMTSGQLKTALRAMTNRPFSDDDRYMGFLKTAYATGMLGGVAGYFSQPNHGSNPNSGGMTGSQYLTAPSWVRQIMDLAHVHGLFTYLEDYLRHGDLLPGPAPHIWQTDLPAYEFPTGDISARVVARQLQGVEEWLVCAWAAGGADRNVTVTIPGLGQITFLARASGAVYRVKPGLDPVLVDADGMNPSNLLHTISLSAGTHGHIEGAAHEAVGQGANETVEFIPDPGYAVSAVMVDGLAQTPASSFTFYNVVADHTLNVSFAPTSQKYVLTLQSDPVGVPLQIISPISQTAVTPLLTDPLVSASMVTLAAPQKSVVGNTTYIFKQWKVNGLNREEGKTTLQLALTRPTTVQAVYVQAANSLIANPQTVLCGIRGRADINLTASGANGAPLTYMLTTPPKYGTLSGVAPHLVYLNVNALNDSFQFTVTDGVLTAYPATVNITVKAVNMPPVATGQAFQVQKNGSSINLRLNANDADGDALTYAVTAGPYHGTLSGTPPNMKYQPDTDFSGWDSFSFQAADALSSSNTAEVNVIVTDPSSSVSLTHIGDKSVAETSLLTFALEAADSQGGDISYIPVGYPAGAMMISNVFSWSPGYKTAGVYPVTFIASSGSRFTAETISITVTHANRMPYFICSDTQTVVEGSKLVFYSSAYDPDAADVITYSAGTLPSGATYNAGSRLFSWTPAVGQAGTYTVRFGVTDNLSPTVYKDVIITVAAKSFSGILGNGDVSGNGTVTMYDAVLTLRGGLSTEQRMRADINGDNTVNAADATAIGRKALGL
ncbi:MAG: putative Ig domain-containing protein [Candidatus Omnitrophica bacterium]|nr:putative Ig domain-containing protein [Candidatus Omnitrophota bacterium]